MNNPGNHPADTAAQAAFSRLFDATRPWHGLTRTARKMLPEAMALSEEDVSGIAEGPIPALAVFSRASSEPGGAGGDFKPPSREVVFARVRGIVALGRALAARDTGFSLRVQDTGTGALALFSSAEAAEAMRGQARLWNVLMLLPLESAEVTPGGMEGMVAAPRPYEVARRVLRREWSLFLTRLPGVACDWDDEYVHEARVALRRVRAALRVFRKDFAILPGETRKVLRELARALGAVRDTDVFLAWLRERQAREIPEDRTGGQLDSLENLALAARRKQLDALLNLLRTKQCDGLIGSFTGTLGLPGGRDCLLPPPAAAKSRTLETMAPRIVRRRLKRVLKFPESLDECSSERLHRLRIACKNARYAAEFFAEYLPGEYARVADAMQKMQDALGEVHDLDVFAGIIREWRRKSPKHSNDTARRLLEQMEHAMEKWMRTAREEWKAARKLRDRKA